MNAEICPGGAQIKRDCSDPDMGIQKIAIVYDFQAEN